MGLPAPSAGGRRAGRHDRPVSGPGDAAGPVRRRPPGGVRGDGGGPRRVRDQESGGGAGLSPPGLWPGHGGAGGAGLPGRRRDSAAGGHRGQPPDPALLPRLRVPGDTTGSRTSSSSTTTTPSTRAAAGWRTWSICPWSCRRKRTAPLDTSGAVWRHGSECVGGLTPPRRPSGPPPGPSAPRPRPGPPGPCGRRPPAGGRWACAGPDPG